MKIKELGERPFLKQIQHMVRKISDAKLDFDDDASDIPMTDEKSLVINVDSFVAKTDWLPGMTEAQAGRKVSVMALSDIVVKGARPIATLLSLCVPVDYEVSKAEEIVRGYSQYCLKTGSLFIGGDLGTSDDIILTGIALGIAPPDGIISRSGACPGDILAVTGRFGLTSVGFEILLNNLEAKESLHKRALQATYKPELHFGFISKLAELDAVSSTMDSSDGLSITLHTMSKRSGCGFVVDDLPDSSGVIEFARKYNLDEYQMIFGGGEEFIHVLTIPEEKWNLAAEVAKDSNIPLQRIGQATSENRVLLRESSGTIEIPVYGYDSFREWV
ncbi:MAG: hypothetical protein BAJATHORv1_20167 [Candidatus Thorarchaeota archaeon]|nr:MAG: hypothetical protein BAJATHORv1_20167 [Candidatus Thorarchaeota archaeon]